MRRSIPPKPNAWMSWAKRLIDLLASSAGLVVLSPLLAWLAWRVHREFGAPVLFRQVRPGLNGKPFTMVKFRTMLHARDGRLDDADRLTPFGARLRSVFRGDMSLVGPRPLLMQYLDLYSPDQARRHEVRPGITGWAQTNGRNAISWEEKLALDVWYVDHRTLWLDLRILAATFWKVIRRDGISAAGEATMPEFAGTAPDSSEAT